MSDAVAVWRCKSCRREVTMPAQFRFFASYACCYADMEYTGTRRQNTKDRSDG